MSYPPPGGYGGGPPQAAPDNNMTMAVVATVLGVLFCCPVGVIPGVMAIVASNKVVPAAQGGNYGAAQQAAADSKKYANIAFVLAGIGLVLNVIYFLTVL